MNNCTNPENSNNQVIGNFEKENKCDENSLIGQKATITLVSNGQRQKIYADDFKSKEDI